MKNLNLNRTVSREGGNFLESKPSNYQGHALKVESNNLIDFYTQRKNKAIRIANTLLKYKKFQFVIDASITATGDLFPLFYAINQIGGKVLLTNLTLQELYKLKNCKEDASSSAAGFILKEAARFPNLFENIVINDPFGSVDDMIIKFCATKRDKVVLLTSDIMMCNTARMYYAVTVHFLLPRRISDNNLPLEKEDSTSDIRTLYFTRINQGKLEINAHPTPYRKISVFSNGVELSNAFVPLHIGDDVFVATSKEAYTTFCHFKLISLSTTNNCEFIFGGRIKDSIDISKLPEASYRSFMREVKREIGL